MFQRFTSEQIAHFDAQYRQRYVLYRSVSLAVEDHEACRGGLRAPEVWHEVLELERQLASQEDMEHFIALERTNLMNKYAQFCSWDGEKWIAEGGKRTEAEIERSTMCVLLALGMRLAQYRDDKPNPYQPVMDRILLMATNCRDLTMVDALANAYYDEEDIQEERGLIAPAEDVLQTHGHTTLSPEMIRVRKRMVPIFQFFHNVLKQGHVKLGPGYTYASIATIWNKLLNEETILRQLLARTSIVNTIAEKHPDAPESIKEGGYNIKMILNLIGILIEKKVILESTRTVSGLFFADNKTIHFMPSRYANFHTGASGLANQEMLDMIHLIIIDSKS